MNQPTTTPASRRECLLFLCHHTRPNAMAALEKLRQEYAHSDVIPLFDQTREQLDLSGIPNARAVTCTEVTALLPYPVKHRHHPGTFWPKNIDLPLLWFLQQEPGYDYYWVIEYDVRFTGHWQFFFDHFRSNTSDLLATTVFDYAFRPGWPHWNSLRSPVRVAPAQRTRAILSFFRISRTALTSVHEAYCAGWGGHYEVAIPTVLRQQGYRLEDMGGNGAYVDPANINRFYTNTPANPGLAPGTYVIRENRRQKRLHPNMLYNPFK
ncbi:MAG: hypothetical protein RLZZ226_2012 [Pseudomonadota bacterium]